MSDVKHPCRISLKSMPFVSEAGSGKAIVPHPHVDRTVEFNVLIYLVEGRMEIIEDGIPYLLLPGTLFFLKKGIHHWGEKPFELGSSWYYVHFYTDSVPDNFMPLKMVVDYPVNLPSDPEQYNVYLEVPKISTLHKGDGLIDKIVRLTSLDSQDVLERSLLMWEILKRSYEEFYGQFANDPLMIRMKILTDYLEEHFSEKTDQATIEDLVGLSYKYICVFFKENTGMTIKAYQTRLRIQKAMKLLGETGLSIGEIAIEIGYLDIYYFSRIFKIETGVSPSDFRKNYRPRI